jgi:hypothetical protein
LQARQHLQHPSSAGEHLRKKLATISHEAAQRALTLRRLNEIKKLLLELLIGKGPGSTLRHFGDLKPRFALRKDSIDGRSVAGLRKAVEIFAGRR